LRPVLPRGLHRVPATPHAPSRTRPVLRLPEPLSSAADLLDHSLFAQHPPDMARHRHREIVDATPYKIALYKLASLLTCNAPRVTRGGLALHITGPGGPRCCRIRDPARPASANRSIAA